MKKSLIRSVCFLLLLAMTLCYTNKILKIKYLDGVYDVTAFYELENDTVDVLILGSSHAYQNINTGTLWSEYGIASYILGSANQPVWNSYYFLKEVLKTQTPELIVLEGYGTLRTEEFMDDSDIMKGTYGLKWSLDKLATITTSSPKERWREFIPEYIQYHSRYAELSRFDFLSEGVNYTAEMGGFSYPDWKGFICNTRTEALEAQNVSGITERLPLSEKTELYYRKTIELAQEHHIPVIVLVTPYASFSEYDASIYNTAADIAAEYQVTFLNCNDLLCEIGIDYVCDAADTSHLNHKGSQKMASFLGKYLKKHYTISDQRGDPRYLSWQRDSDFIAQLTYDQELRELQEPSMISAKLLNPNYLCFISVDGNCIIGSGDLQPFYAMLGIAGYSTYDGGIWYRDNAADQPDGFTWYSQQHETVEKCWRYQSHDFCLRRTGNGGIYTNHIIIDNTEYKKVQNGINVVVYDRVTESVADSFGINMDNDCALVR